MLLAAGISIGLLVWNFGFGRWKELDRLARGGVPSKAAITSTQCGGHGTFFYSYEAGGQVFRGSGYDLGSVAECREGAPARGCQDLRPGDSVGIVYLAADPSVSASGDPAPQRDAILVPEIVMALAPFILGLAAVHGRTKRPREMHDPWRGDQ